MTDHAVLIPTPKGPVGGIVSEPDGERRAALLLLAGYGRPARSGVNGFWTRTARQLAARGVVVLRVDYSREGETLPIGEGGSGQRWKRDLDLSLLHCVVPWFRARVTGMPLLLAGACSGARLSIELAGGDPAGVAGTFLVAPYLRSPAEPGKEGNASQEGIAPVDPQVVECFRAILARRPSWILVGECDDADVDRLRAEVEPTVHELAVEVVPGVALHLLDHPRLQDETAVRLIARVERCLPGSSRHANWRTREFFNRVFAGKKQIQAWISFRNS